MAVNFQTAGPKGTGTGVGVSEREDLANFISLITRDETPFMSSIGKTKSKAILHEWQTDELSVPTSAATVEGASFNTVSTAQADEPFRTRLGNYTQINSKTVEVSGSKRAVDQAGVADEYAYQLKKRGTELRRDLEHDLVHSWNPSNGSGTRTLGGYQAYINDVDNTIIAGASSYTAPGTTGIGDVGVIVRGAADANLVEIELSQVDDAMQSIYESGGKANTIMTSPSNKRLFSSKAQAADSNVRRNIDETGKLRQSVELYESDFGLIKVVPNYIMGLAFNTSGDGTTDSADFAALVYDPSWFKIATLRSLHETEIGQLGDSTIGQIVEECTLEVRNPSGCGMIVGIGG